MLYPSARVNADPFDNPAKLILEAFVKEVCFQGSMRGALIEVNGKIIFEGGFEFSFQVTVKLGHSAVVFVLFLAVSD